MHKPLISVVIPTYNRADSLMLAVNSALGQTYENFEIIIVSDGSTDHTDNIVAPLVNGKVRYLRLSENCGGGKARNTGIADARGTFVAFLDDDDVWLPSKLAEQLDFINTRNVDICYTAMRKMYWKNRWRQDRFNSTPPVNPIKAILTDNYIGPTSSVMIYKSFLDRIGGFDHQLLALQDWDLYIRLIQAGAKAEGLNRVLVEYYKIDENTVSRNFRNFYSAGKHIITKLQGNPYRFRFQIRFYTILAS